MSNQRVQNAEGEQVRAKDFKQQQRRCRPTSEIYCAESEGVLLVKSSSRQEVRKLTAVLSIAVLPMQDVCTWLGKRWVGMAAGMCLKVPR